MTSARWTGCARWLLLRYRRARRARVESIPYSSGISVSNFISTSGVVFFVPQNLSGRLSCVWSVEAVCHIVFMSSAGSFCHSGNQKSDSFICVFLYWYQLIVIEFWIVSKDTESRTESCWDYSPHGNFSANASRNLPTFMYLFLKLLFIGCKRSRGFISFI